MESQKKIIRSLLLAAGFGTRLRPLTLKTPKCLIKIGDKPVLELWLEKLQKLGVKETLVNTHYLSDLVRDFLESKKFLNIQTYEIFEEKLLGTAGTLFENKDFFNNCIGLLIHADNFTLGDLSGLIEAHINKPKDCILTMLTFESKNPEKCGIVRIDDRHIVTEFHEKILNPPGNLANGAIYVFDDEFLKWLEVNAPNASDFSTEVLPKLMGKIFTWKIDSEFIDIGTLDSYQRAIDVFNSKN